MENPEKDVVTEQNEPGVLIAQPDPDVQVGNKATRVKKGMALPSLTFVEMKGILAKIAGRAADDGDYILLGQVLGNSPSSSSFSHKMVCLKSYGVITAQDKEWELTDIGKRIAYPRSDEDQLLAIQTAFSTYPMLNTIWTQYKGKPLQVEHVPNAIEAYCGVPSTLKDAWAKYFIDAVREAKLTVDINGSERVAENFIRVKVPAQESGAQGTPPQHEAVKRTTKHHEQVADPADAIEELAKVMTRGTKLSKRAGSAYVLFYIEDTLTNDDAAEVERVLDAAKAILNLYKPKN